MTSYVVLKQSEPGQWQEFAIEEAHSAKEAVTKAFLKEPQNVVAIVAIPARSFRPTPIRLESKPRAILGKPESAQHDATETL